MTETPTQQTEATRVDVLSSIERRVAALDEPESFTRDDALRMLDDIDGIKHRADVAEKALKAFLVGWLPSHGRELRLGTKKWWVGPKKNPPKCKDVRRTLEAIMIATGGDYERACDALSSGAIKYGEARKILGDAFNDHFEQVTEDKLFSEDSGPVLNCVDEKYVKGGTRN